MRCSVYLAAMQHCLMYFMSKQDGRIQGRWPCSDRDHVTGGDAGHLSNQWCGAHHRPCVSWQRIHRLPAPSTCRSVKVRKGVTDVCEVLLSLLSIVDAALCVDLFPLAWNQTRDSENTNSEFRQNPADASPHSKPPERASSTEAIPSWSGPLFLRHNASTTAGCQRCKSGDHHDVCASSAHR